MEYTKQYIAGFFDGEGSIGVYSRNQRGFHLRTQLTQNKSKNIKQLMEYLLSQYGGNLSEQATLSGGIKYNWQLNADKAVVFLEEISPFLILKKNQADIAIWWQKQRPARIRNKKGQIVLKKKVDVTLDNNVLKIIKLLKTQDIDEVMENSKELVEVRHVLRQIVSVKGD